MTTSELKSRSRLLMNIVTATVKIIHIQVPIGLTFKASLGLG